MPRDTGNKIGLYLVNGIAGNNGLPGATILRFSLIVNAVSGKVTGQAKQTQALAPPFDEIFIYEIAGDVSTSPTIIRGEPQDLQLVTLKGTALVPLGTPPVFGEYISPFTAFFEVDSKWKGSGSWAIGKSEVKNVPVREETFKKVKGDSRSSGTSSSGTSSSGTSDDEGKD